MSYADIKLTEASYCRSFEVNQPVIDIDIDINGQILTVTEDVIIDAGNMFNFYDWVAVSNDMANGKIIVGGILTLLGNETEDLEINNLDWVAIGGIALYCNVYNSQNTGGIDIDATDASNTDNGSNTGWDFGVSITLLDFERGFYRGFARGCK